MATPKDISRLQASPIDSSFDYDSIVEYVKGMLGSPPLRVELTVKNFDICVQKAFEAYSHMCPLIRRTSFPVGGDGRYALPETARGVLEVQPQRTSNFLPPASTVTMNLGDGVVFRHLPNLRDTYGIDQINEILNYNEMTLRVLSADFQYEIYEGYIYVQNVPPGTGSIALIYSEDHTYETVPRTDRALIKDYTLAIAKIQLGQVRMKFNTPGPAGQQLLKEAGDLKQEGMQEKAELEARILKRAYQIPPVMD